jgi:hypothetical protein
MATEPEKENVLVATAKTIGKAAGKIAALAGAKGEQPKARAMKGRLSKTNKNRLPRRQKKAQKKKARRAA